MSSEHRESSESPPGRESSGPGRLRLGRAGGSTGSKVTGRRPSERCLGRTGASQEGNLRKGAASGSPGPRPPWAVKEGRWSEGTTPPSSSSPDAGSRKPPGLPGAASPGRARAHRCPFRNGGVEKP